MLLISNNVDSLGINYPKGAVIRINTAWVNTKDALEDELIRLKDHDIYLDYPIGRKKPPLPKMSFESLFILMMQYENIKYFAWSNAEIPEDLAFARDKIPQRIMLVPKIETLIGVLRLEEIVKASQTKLIMIDKEDLATAAGNAEIYQHFLEHTRKKAEQLGIEAIELKGVIFAEAEK